MSAPDIDFVPHFIPEPDALFEQLKHSVLWDERMRARKTASFGVPYDYSQISYPAVPMPEALGQLCPAIERLLGFAPNNCLLNFYPDGQSSMGFHSDANEQLIAGTGVVVISLGHSRSMLFKHKQSGVIHEYSLPSGSLLHMSDELQTQWLHAIPKAPGAGERISLSFRQLKEQ